MCGGGGCLFDFCWSITSLHGSGWGGVHQPSPSLSSPCSVCVGGRVQEMGPGSLSLSPHSGAGGSFDPGLSGRSAASSHCSGVAGTVRRRVWRGGGAEGPGFPPLPQGVSAEALPWAPGGPGDSCLGAEAQSIKLDPPEREKPRRAVMVGAWKAHLKGGRRREVPLPYSFSPHLVTPPQEPAEPAAGRGVDGAAPGPAVAATLPAELPGGRTDPLSLGGGGAPGESLKSLWRLPWGGGLSGEPGAAGVFGRGLHPFSCGDPRAKARRSQDLGMACLGCPRREFCP